jgi:hypothetical protein
MPSNSLNKGSSSGELAGDLASNQRLNASGEKAGNLEKQEASLNNDLREHLDAMFEGLLFLSEREFDAAILGVAERIGMSPIVAYDTAKILDILCERDGMEGDEALEYFEFNIAGAYVGERTPIFIGQIHSIL